MHLEQLRLEGFRNYKRLEVHFGEHLNVFVGNNAQGKTNLLEAVYMLATGRSYRAAGDQELVGWGETAFSISTVVARTFGTLTIQVLYSPERRKKVRVNGSDLKKLSALFGNLNAVIFSPEDLQIVKNSPAHRRRFLDLGLSQVDPAYRAVLIDYQDVLLQRNNVLKASGAGGGRRDREMLEVWNEQLVRFGAKVLSKRMVAVAHLTRLAREAHARITDGAEDLHLQYLAAFGGDGAIGGVKPGDREPAIPEEWTESRLRERLAAGIVASQPTELRRGISLVGPHRDDLGLAIDGNDARAFGSQGQQRTAALALKLAELEFMREEVGEYPVLLLDDVMSELDAARRRFLLDVVQPKAQMFVTTTGLHSFQDRHLDQAKVFRVERGSLSLA